ncbi:unnamed protein product [Symbiodinium natans]|uniref:Uncharacterized protein n=1 Tax=Symbiodinium natans TaxID=878477 RepID=A0A812K9N3_9DINO|nr:unnamed protein product [Symbiodinium natans]
MDDWPRGRHPLVTRALQEEAKPWMKEEGMEMPAVVPAAASRTRSPLVGNMLTTRSLPVGLLDEARILPSLLTRLSSIKEPEFSGAKPHMAPSLPKPRPGAGIDNIGAAAGFAQDDDPKAIYQRRDAVLQTREKRSLEQSLPALRPGLSEPPATEDALAWLWECLCCCTGSSRPKA